MRLFILLLFLSSFCCNSYSLDIDKRTASALENINQGYVQYGFEELKKSAAMNDIAAQFFVAVCYEYGIGVEKDLSNAFKMYRKAAERGLPDAMFHIASFYRKGAIVSQDLNKENEWLQRFEQRGGKLTLPNILDFYIEGSKYPMNYALNPNDSNVSNSNLNVQNNGNNNSQEKIINNITIIQQATVQKDNYDTSSDNQSNVELLKPEVDQNIPVNQEVQEKTFALIIANENYQEVANVPNALNDGIIFSEYCKKTIGIPESNIKLLKDATLNNIRRQISWLNQVMDAYNGDASVIIYYAGHGIPNERDGAAYLLPIDGFGSDVTTGYSLDKLYTEFSNKPAKTVVVILDACFSGTRRDGGMLVSSRGVAIKAKQNANSIGYSEIYSFMLA